MLLSFLSLFFFNPLSKFLSTAVLFMDHGDIDLVFHSLELIKIKAAFLCLNRSDSLSGTLLLCPFISFPFSFNKQ